MNSSFINWVRNNGGYVHQDIFMNDFKLYSKNLINGSVIKIPNRLMLNSGILEYKFDCENKYRNMFEFSLTLIQEILKGESSFFYPFIKVLPGLNDLSDHCLLKYSIDDVILMKRYYPICAEYILIMYDAVNSFMESIEGLKFVVSDNVELPCENSSVGSRDFKVSKDLVKYVFVIYYTCCFENYGLVPLLHTTRHCDKATGILNIANNSLECEMSDREMREDLYGNYEILLSKYNDGVLSSGVIHNSISETLYIASELKFDEIFERNLTSNGIRDKTLYFKFTDDIICDTNLVKGRLLFFNDIVDGSEMLDLNIENKAIKLLLYILNRSHISVYRIDVNNVFRDNRDSLEIMDENISSLNRSESFRTITTDRFRDIKKYCMKVNEIIVKNKIFLKEYWATLIE